MNNKLSAGTRPPPSSSQPGDELPEHTAPVCQPLPCPRHMRWIRPFVNAETWNDRRTQNQPAASTASVGRTWLEGELGHGLRIAAKFELQRVVALVPERVQLPQHLRPRRAQTRSAATRNSRFILS